MAGLINSEGPFNIWDRPAAFPWADLVNGVNDKPVFDLKVDLDDKDGVAYVQVDHVIAMARTLGMVTKEEHEEVIRQHDELLEKNPQTEIERLTNAVSELSGLVRGFVSGTSTPAISLEKPAEAESAESGSSETSRDGDESPVVERPDELPSSPDNDTFGFAGLGKSDTKSSRSNAK